MTVQETIIRPCYLKFNNCTFVCLKPLYVKKKTPYPRN